MSAARELLHNLTREGRGWMFSAPRVVTADGTDFVLSVQASQFHYCEPRVNGYQHATSYQKVEVGLLKLEDGDWPPEREFLSPLAVGLVGLEDYGGGGDPLGYVPTEELITALDKLLAEGAQVLPWPTPISADEREAAKADHDRDQVRDDRLMGVD